MRDLVGIWALWYGNEQKVGFAEKKLRLTQKMAHRVYQSLHPSPTAKKNFDKGQPPVKIILPSNYERFCDER